MYDEVTQLKNMRRALDNKAKEAAGLYNLWPELLPAVAYAPGRLADAVIQLLTYKRKEWNRAASASRSS